MRTRVCLCLYVHVCMLCTALVCITIITEEEVANLRRSRRETREELDRTREWK